MFMTRGGCSAQLHTSPSVSDHQSVCLSPLLSVCLVVLRGICVWLLSVWMFGGNAGRKWTWFLDYFDERWPVDADYFYVFRCSFFCFFFFYSYHPLFFIKYKINYVLSFCAWMSCKLSKRFYYYCHCMRKGSVTIHWAIIVLWYFVHY